MIILGVLIGGIIGGILAKKPDKVFEFYDDYILCEGKKICVKDILKIYTEIEAIGESSSKIFKVECKNGNLFRYEMLGLSKTESSIINFLKGKYTFPIIKGPY